MLTFTYTLEITATDEAGNVATQYLSVVVVGRLMFDSTMLPDAAYIYITGQAIPPLILPSASGGMAPLSYTLSGAPDWLTFSTERTLIGTPSTPSAAIVLTYTVVDGSIPLATDTLTFTVTVIDPLIFDAGAISLLASDYSYITNMPFTPLPLPAATGGTDPLTYTLMPAAAIPAGLTFDSSARTLAGTPTTATTTTTTLTYAATDANGMSVTAEFSLSGRVMVASVAAPAGFYKADASVPVTITFSEPVTVNGTLQLTLATGNSSGNAMVSYTSGSGTALLTFTYTVLAGDDTSNLAYTGTDALSLNSGTIQNAAAIDAELTLPKVGTPDSLSGSSAVVLDTTVPMFATASAADNRVPVTAAIDANTATEIYNAAATDRGDDTGITYALTGTDALTFAIDPNSGALTPAVTVTLDTVATYTLEITATDEAGNVATQYLSVVVVGRLMFDSTMLPDAAYIYITGQAIPPLILPSASGGMAPLSYTLSGAPDWLTFSTERTLIGTPTTPSAAIVLTYTVVDGSIPPATDTLTFTVTVIDPLIFDASAISLLASDYSYITNMPFTPLTLPAATGGTDPLTYTLMPAAAIPAGLTFDSSARTLAGTPTTATTTTTTLTYAATDANGMSVTAEFSLSGRVMSDLSALTVVASDGVAVPLSPDFDAATYAYTARVIQEVTSVTITTTSSRSDAMAVTFTGTAEDGDTLNIADTTVTSDTVTVTSATVSVTDGANTIIITVPAAGGTTTVYTITLTRAPLLTFGTDDSAVTVTIDDQIYDIGVPISDLTLPIARGGTDMLSYALTSEAGIPAGLAFAPATRILSGTPTALVTRTLTYSITDGAAPPVSTTLTFNVMIVREVDVPDNTDDIPLNLDEDTEADDGRLILPPGGHDVTKVAIGKPLQSVVDNPPVDITFARTVDIAIVDGGLMNNMEATVCLPTTDVPVGRDPLLYHYTTDSDQTPGTEAWREIGNDLSREGLVCGTTATFSPFAVGYDKSSITALTTRLNEQILTRASQAMAASTLEAVAPAGGSGSWWHR